MKSEEPWGPVSDEWSVISKGIRFSLAVDCLQQKNWFPKNLQSKLRFYVQNDCNFHEDLSGVENW